MRILVCLATSNERDNLPALVEQIRQAAAQCDLLVIGSKLSGKEAVGAVKTLLELGARRWLTRQPAPRDSPRDNAVVR